MARSFPSVVSPASEVHFAGWRSNTYTLEQNGWEVAIQEEPLYGKLEIMVLHTPTGFIGFGNCNDYDYRRRLGRSGRDVHPVFCITRLDQKIRFQQPRSMAAPLSDFSWIDAKPEYAMISDIDAFETPLFKRRGVPIPTAEALIVEPRTVMELLEEIRKRQAPDQAAIRERMRRAEVMQQTHAQIISFREAA